MTLVQNRLLPLSGNKWLIFAMAGLLLAACSPKVRPVAPAQPVEKPAEKPAEVKTVSLPPIFKPTISLILPFQLDNIDLSKGAPKSTLAKADVAVEFYQGFKLALDSLTARNLNFKLVVYDSKDEMAQARSFAVNAKVRSSDVVIGPVYPEGVKSFTNAFGGLKRILVSPLSPTPPDSYKYPGLVTMMPPLGYHAQKTAGFISARLKAKKVFILRSGYTEDNKYIIPFKKAIDSLGKKRIKIVDMVIVRGDLTTLIPQLSLIEGNIFLIPATNKQFVQVTMRSLELLQKKHYPITVFGHPLWEDATYLKPEQLQALNTYITSSDRVNYKSPNVIRFIKDFRKIYHAEPGEYAIKGFDEGMYWGQFVSQPGQTIASFNDMEGLHNTFHFVNIPGLGYVNTSVKLYKYANFELKPVE